MKDWNVLISVNPQGFSQAFNVLREFGPIKKTSFFNVLIMKAENPREMVDALLERSSKDPGYLSFLSRLMPVAHAFTFKTPEEFRADAKEIILTLAPRLGDRSFHVRIHRRGFKGRLSSPEEERFLDETVLESLEKAGTPGRISFDDPDAVISIETVENQAGISLWTREDLQKYPFIRPD